MLAASRAAASRHARMTSGFHAGLPGHLQGHQAQQGQHPQQAQQHPYLMHLQAQQQQAQQAQHAAVQRAAAMAALQQMAAARLLPFPAAPSPLGPPPGIPGAGITSKAADSTMAGGAASPLPPQAQQEGGAPEFEGVRLMMTPPSGFGSLLDVGNIFDDLLP